MFPNQIARENVFSKSLNFAKGINWSGILDGTQKTLGIINQALPIIYQVKPIISNARTMFKIADVINSNQSESEEVIATPLNTNKPIFYI